LTELRPTARVARGATYVFIQGFLTAIISVVYFIVLAHNLSTEEMGGFALLSFIGSLPQVLGTFALPSAAIKYIAQHLAENSPEKARAVVTRILQISFLSSTVSFLLLFVPAEFTSSLMFGNSDYVLHLRLMAFVSVFSILYIIVISFLQGLQRMREVSLISLTYTLIHVSVGAYLLLSGWHLLAVVLAWLVGLSAISVAGLILTVKYMGFARQLYPVKPLFNFSFPLYVSGSIGSLVGWVDQLILASFSNLATLGVYHVAIRASVVPTLFANSIVIALFPKLSELYAKQGAGSLKDAFRVSGHYAALIGFPLIFGVAILAYPTTILLAGVQFGDAALPLIIISLAALIGTLGIAVGPILYTLERTRVASLLSIVAVVLHVSLSFFALGVLGLGMVGTAWARTLASIAGLVLSLFVLARYVPLSFDREAIWKALAASALMVLAIVGLDLVRMVLSPSSYEFLAFRLHLLPVYIIAGALAYFVSIVLLRALKKQDLELIDEYLPKRLKWAGDLLRRFVKVE